MTELTTIPARGGKAAHVGKGQAIRIINTHGEQVVDTWAFCADDMSEYMAMDATRAYNKRLAPIVGDKLVTNRRRPILTLEEDTSPGRHDTLMAACDRWRYGLLGVEGYHDNCADNLSGALAELGLQETHTPSPLNVFMNIPWELDGALDWGETHLPPRRLHPAARRVGLCRGHVGLSAGYSAHQRQDRATHGSTFRNPVVARSERTAIPAVPTDQPGSFASSTDRTTPTSPNIPCPADDRGSSAKAVSEE